MGIIAGMDASSRPRRGGVNDARRLVRDAARPLPARARAGVVRPDRRRHLRLPRDADRAAGVPVPRAEPHRVALDRRLRRRPRSCVADPHWLPFPENALDLIVLPHALEFTDDPHQLLREVYRAMRPEGQIVIAGFNPFSLFGAKRYFGRGRRRRGTATSSRSTGSRTGSRCSASRSPAAASTATCRRSRRRSGCARFGFFETAGDRWWPIARRRLLPARDQAGARHARDHAGVGAAASGARTAPRQARECIERQAAMSADAAPRRRPRRDATTRRRDVVTIYTDGACKGNPGPGGWGALLACGEHEKELFGGEAHTTNNRMELTAVIRALESAQARLRRRALHRLAVREERDRDLDPRLEAERLEDRGPQAGQERRPLARARRAGRAAPDPLALGAGPHRPSGQRARRRARQSRRAGIRAPRRWRADVTRPASPRGAACRRTPRRTRPRRGAHRVASRAVHLGSTRRASPVLAESHAARIG